MTTRASLTVYHFNYFRMMKICAKVGEGVYGEVFRTQNSGQSVALKVNVTVTFFFTIVQIASVLLPCLTCVIIPLKG